MSDSDLAFSRTASSNVFGKLIAERKTMLPEALDAKLVMLASLAGQTPSEYIRDVLTLHMVGHATLAMLQSGRQNGRPVSWPEAGGE